MKRAPRPGDVTREAAPILVTGLPRSGTSWAGKMLTAGGGAVYVNEPLNPQRPPGRSPGVLNATVEHRFQYICRDDEEAWRRAFADTVALRYQYVAELRRNRSPGDLARLAKNASAFALGRARRRRALLDDPFALFSAGWFAERLGCRVVLLVRDPASLVASWRRLGWTVHLHELLEQPLLLRDHPVVGRVRPLAGSPDHVAAIATLWAVAREVAGELTARHPAVRLVSYEHLAADPLAGYRDLYAWCGLPWTPRAARRVERACTTGSRAARPPHDAPAARHGDTRTDGSTRASGSTRTDGSTRAGGSTRTAGSAQADGSPRAGGFAWTGLSRTAYRRMDSASAAARPPAGLTAQDLSLIEAITR
ncbi:sulfotransferase [Sphaerisporangium rhizosphaerae]|uniref:Sulfotransferase n=1 Tax=Sphaerisporangium rhizosphaerae TaxID=2269375 RepID=A0ABW2P5U2_9ACTN